MKRRRSERVLTNTPVNRRFSCFGFYGLSRDMTQSGVYEKATNEIVAFHTSSVIDP